MNSQDYTKQISGAMDEVLRAAGFRKKGLVFIAQREDCFHVVELLKERSTTRDCLVADIPFGAFSPALARACAERDKDSDILSLLKGYPLGLAEAAAGEARGRLQKEGSIDETVRPSRIYDCHWVREWPESGPFSVSSQDEADKITLDAAKYLQEAALPALAKLVSASQLHNRLYEGKDFGNPTRTYTCLRVLMEWAVTEGKPAYYGGVLLTEEFFPRPDSSPSAD